MFIATQFLIAKCWKQPKCPSVDEWLKRLWYIYTQWNTMQQKIEGIPTFCDNIVGTGDYYAKWNKPVGEIQMPYDLTHKRNLMNRIN